MGSRRLTLAWLLLLLTAAHSLAAATLDVEAGFGNRFRPGRWSPVIVTVSNDKPLTAVLEVRVANATSSVMNIRQAVGVGPQKQTYVVYAPLAMLFDPVRVSLVNPGSGKVLARWPEDPNSGVNTRFGFGGEQVGFFAVTSGRSPVMQNLVYERGGGISIVSHQPQKLLPTTPVGYDSIDLLYLNNPDWSSLSTDQHRAIVDWVRAGGQLMVWPGIESIPTESPVAQILPCSVGEVTPLNLDANALKAAGLPQRFAALAQRTLTPLSGASTVALLSGRTQAVTKRIGLGSVTVMPFEASTLQFNGGDQFRTFWTSLLQQAVDGKPASAKLISTGNTNGLPAYLNVDDMQAAYSALDRIGDIPNTGSFGFSYIVIVIGLMMLIVGPIDFFVLKKIGRQPWTWATTAGWIGLVTVGAIYAGHLMRSGDLHYRTIRLVEQADDVVVSRDEVALIYAPRSSTYAIESDVQAWWQPVPTGARYGSSEFSTPLDLHQDYRGTRPEPMWIDLWGYRLLQSRRIGTAAPLVIAKLTRAGDRIRGTITNTGTEALTAVRIDVGTQSASVEEACGPGQTLTIDAPLGHAKEQPEDAGTVRLRRRATASPVEEGGDSYAQLFAINQKASQAVARLTETELPASGGPAILYATIKNEAAATTITDPTAVQQHQTLLRAIIELQP